MLKKIVDLCLGLDNSVAIKRDHVDAANALSEMVEHTDHMPTKVQQLVSNGLEAERKTMIS